MSAQADRRPVTSGRVDGAPAGAVTRLGAYVLDAIVMSSLLAGGAAVAAFLVGVVIGRAVHAPSDRGVATVVSAVWWFAYFGGSWAATGRTVGMAVFGVRVVGRDGGPVATLPAFVRALALVLSITLFGLGFLVILFQRQRRALHDLIARTLVVYDDPSSRRFGGHRAMS